MNVGLYSGVIEEVIKVTKTDIKKGKKEADNCPVARALNRALKIYGVRVVIDQYSDDGAYVFSRRGRGKYHFGGIDLPEVVFEFSRKFYEDKKVEPFSFVIKFCVMFDTCRK
jgi:hypothetical protein